MQITENNLVYGMTFSEGLTNFRENNDKNIFEKIITVNTIEEDENLTIQEKDKLIEILNSNMNPFEKRIRIMRALDKEKDFSSKIAIVLQKKLGKMDMVKEILTIFRDEYVKKDILKKYFGEVLTPLSMVKQMVYEIEEDFWNTPIDENGNIKKILETSNGSGIFLWCVLYKFMYGLKNYFPDENERYKFIIENMIFACELQKSKMFNWLCTTDLYDEYNLNVYCGSYLDEGFDNHMREVWKIDSVSLTISNPPYQETIEGNNRARPLYNLFVEKSLKFSDKILFITPSRWLAGGFGLDNFRKMMFNRKDIKVIKHFDDATKVFGNDVDIVGGVSYFLIDKKYNGEVLFDNNYCILNKYDIWVKPEYHNILDKVISENNLSKICKSKSFWMNFNDNELDSEKRENNILCYVAQNKGLKKYIKKDKLSNSSNLLINKYKIFTPAANGEKPNFGNLIIGHPNESSSNTYMTLYCDTIEQVESLKSYMSTKFCNFFLSLRKNTQNLKPDTLKWIPIVPLDREWSDELLFDYFNLTFEEKSLIRCENHKIILSINNEEIKFEGYIDIDNIVISEDKSKIMYRIEIPFLISKKLKDYGIKTTCINNKYTPLLFDGNLNNDELSLEFNKYNKSYYLYRRNFGNHITDRIDWISYTNTLFKWTPSEQLEQLDKDFESDTLIDFIKIYYNDILIRTERYESGNIISNGDIEDIFIDKRDHKLKKLGI